MADPLALDWVPRTAEEALQEELDWYFLVTGRNPAVVRCSRSTMRRYVTEGRYRLGTAGLASERHYMPFALAVVGVGGVAIPVEFDESIPEGSWRAA